MHPKSLQSCPALCNAMDCSPPVSSVHGILQARILEWVAMPSSRESPQPRDGTQVSCIAGEFYFVDKFICMHNFLFLDCVQSQLEFFS